MPIALPTGYLRTTIEPLDVRYNNEITGLPYANVAAAFAATQTIAYTGLFVNIDDGAGGSDLYWYKTLTGPQPLPPLPPVPPYPVIGDLVAFSAGGGGGNITLPTTPTTAAAGAYTIGTIFTGPQNMQDMWENMLFPYVQPIITGALTPTTNLYNAQNVTISPNIGSGPFFFIWTRAAGAPNLVSAIIEVKRSNQATWTQLATTTTPASPYTTTVVNVDLSAPLIINTAGFDNNPFEMRCEFVDANSVTPYYSSTITSTFAPYVAPVTNNLSVIPKDGTGASLLSAGTVKYVRSFVSYAQTDITGTITGNTPLINMTNYELYQSATGTGGWSVLPTSSQPITPPNPTSAIMTAYADTSTSLASIQDYYIQTYVATQNTPGTYLPINVIKSYNMYNPVFAGLISNATYLGPVSGWLPNVFNGVPYTAQALIPNGSSNNGGVCNYQRNANDRLLTNLNFQTVTNGDRFIVAYPASYPTMTNFGPIGTNLVNNFYPAGTPLPNNSPIPIIQSIIFGDGSNVSYQIYIYGLALSGGGPPYLLYNIA